VRSDYWRIPAVVISDDRFGPATIALLSRSARSNFRPTVLYSLGPSEEDGRNLVTPIPIEPAPLHSRSAMILSLPAIGPGPLRELAAHYSSRFLTVLSIPAVTGNSEVWFERVDGSRSPVERFRVSLWQQIAKRSFDLVVCLALLLPMLPVFVLIAAAIRLDTKGSIFYTQRRIGRSGNSFEMLKFRTMRPDAEARLAAHLDSDVAFRREWDLYQKLAEDPRVTRVGGVLRKLSLDELPQMLNVIRGDMSLIGPRPMFAGQEPHYGRDFELYTQVRPGLTGLWQISGRNRITFQDRAWLDGFYVRHLSFWLDTYIMLKTPLAVLRGEGRAD
jgi:lipopolysaccharide/colanic/teichoic acid biosynthesis glycosyltransferase